MAGITTIKLPAVSGLPTREEIARSVRSALADGPPVIELDFANADFVDSSMLGTLQTLRQECEALGGSLLLNNVASDFYQLFAMTRLNERFYIRPPRTDTDDETAPHLALLK